MQYKHICGIVALALFITHASFAQEQPRTSLQFNLSGSTSWVLGTNESEIISTVFRLDPAFGLTGRTAAKPKLGIRYGAYFARTSARYTINVPLGSNLPEMQAVEITRTRLGLRIPLTFDIALANSERMRFAWLIGALMHVDFEDRNIYNFVNVENPPALTQGQQLPLGLAFQTGFEWVFHLKNGRAMALATELTATAPNNTSYAYSDFSPSASLLSAGLRVTYELAAEPPKTRDKSPEKSRKNVVSLGYGGRTYNQSANIGYERQMIELNWLRASLQATGGYGTYGLFGTVGPVASMGSSKHAFDLGFGLGYIGELEQADGVFEYGYRYTSAKGFVGRAYFNYWGDMSFLGATAVGVSFGKAF
jgi:hypothetical protein